MLNVDTILLDFIIGIICNCVLVGVYGVWGIAHKKHGKMWRGRVAGSSHSIAKLIAQNMKIKVAGCVWVGSCDKLLGLGPQGPAIALQLIVCATHPPPLALPQHCPGQTPHLARPIESVRTQRTQEGGVG